MTNSARADLDELPKPDAAFVLIRVALEAHLSTIPRKQAKAFLAKASAILADEETATLLFPIRPASHHAEVTRARREALAMWRQLLPTLLARVPPE